MDQLNPSVKSEINEVNKLFKNKKKLKIIKLKTD